MRGYPDDWTDLDAFSCETRVPVNLLHTLAGISDPRNEQMLTAHSFLLSRNDKMNVRDLIALLQQLPQDARVVLPDPSASEGARVYSAGFGEVQRIELGAWESNGLMVVEPWEPGHVGWNGPFDGILIGTLFQPGELG